MNGVTALACLAGATLAAVGVLQLAAHDSPHAAELGSAAAQVKLTSAQSDYLEHCGGCHGLQGDSTPSPIPVLKNRVGYFMCTEGGREYLGRLPNIAYADIGDEDLAQLLNFVVFDLGGGTAPARSRPFNAAEVHRLRAQPLTGSAVEDTRTQLIANIFHACAAPESLRQPYAVQSADAR